MCFLENVGTHGASAGGLGDESRTKVLDEIAAVQTVDVILTNAMRRGDLASDASGKPTEHQAILLHKLGNERQRALFLAEATPRTVTARSPPTSTA